MNSEVIKVKPDDRVSVIVEKLTVTVKGTNHSGDIEINSSKAILDDITFNLKQGEMMAIMGGSGSGKTTLLDTLSARLNDDHNTLQFQGRIAFKTDSNLMQIRSSYLKQTDSFLRGLTVFETLKYQADLRLPSTFSEHEKVTLILTLLDILELTHLEDTVITSFTNTTNLSGGEQRRVSLAIQLINKPSILFLDEPTTGLDASSSLKLIYLLRKLASSNFGITIILSIHQPRVEITKLFDKLCMLTKGGRLVYYGNFMEAADYFNNLPFIKKNIGKSTNFIDYIMCLSVNDSSSNESEMSTSYRIRQLVQNYHKSIESISSQPSVDKSRASFKLLQNQLSKPTKDKLPLYKEIYYLTTRTFKLSLRDRMSLLSLNGGSLLLAVSYGWMFFRPKHDLAGIRSLQSALYLALEIVGFTPMFIEVERLWSNDGLNFFREYQENCVSIPAFIISRRLGKMLLEDIPMATIWTIVTYFMWGLRGGVGQFFVYYVIILIACMFSFLVAMMSFAISSDFPVSLLIINIFYQIQNCACGFFVNAASMPIYVRWVKYLAYCWYAYGALMTNQFAGWEGSCPYDDASRCVEYTGDFQLTVFGYPKRFIAQSIGILLTWMVIYYMIMYVAFKFKNYDMSMSTIKKNTIGDEELDDKESLTSGEKDKESTLSTLVGEKVDSVDINLDSISLVVQPKSILVKLNKQQEPTILLNNITTCFKSNSLNVIMGPSGSGKSTLLNYLVDRLPRSTRFKATGSININGYRNLTNAELGKISAYVPQFDNTLISNLTVRETLYFQARLRLPKHERHDASKIVNSLIRGIGLLECADTLIGSESVKGISGGERRRVSIGIQLLDRPKILMLDEPTSGLDSSTAYSIICLLHDLARNNNNTIILTIHQPNEDMIELFNTVLLMSKGGNVIYSGLQSGLLPYFQSINYSIAPEVNLANFALDLVSRAYDESAEIVEARISHLKECWSTIETPVFKTLDLKALSSNFEVEDYQRKRVPFIISLSTIFKRQLLSTFRSFDILFTRIFQAVGMAIVVTLFFAPLKNSQDGVANRLGLIQEILNLYIVGILNNIALYPVERDIFYQEYKDGIYGVFAYCLSYTLNELPLEIISSILFSVLVVFGIGLPRTLTMYFVMTFASIASINCGESIGFVVNCIFDHLGFAVNLVLIILSHAVFMGGVMSLHLPAFFKSLNWINPMKYVVWAIANLGFENQQFDCGAIDCTLATGKQVLEAYDLTANIGVSLVALLVCMVVYRVAATLAVYCKVRYFI